MALMGHRNEFSNGTSGEPSVVLDPDFVWIAGTSVRLVVEVKPFWSFPYERNLVLAYTRDIRRSKESKIVRGVQQGISKINLTLNNSLRIRFLQYVEVLLPYYAA